MASLRFHIKDIPPLGLECTQRVGREALFLEENDPATEGDFTVSVHLTLVGSDVMVKGESIGTLALECVRCLSHFTQPLRIPFEGVFLDGDSKHSEGGQTKREDDEEAAEGLEVYPLQEDHVSLGEMLREQVILEVPMQPLCSLECKGLCPQCGENLNRKQCHCPPVVPPSPFSVLRNLVQS